MFTMDAFMMPKHRFEISTKNHQIKQIINNKTIKRSTLVINFTCNHFVELQSCIVYGAHKIDGASKYFDIFASKWKIENEKQIDVDVEQSRNILNKYVDTGKTPYGNSRKLFIIFFAIFNYIMIQSGFDAKR